MNYTQNTPKACLNLNSKFQTLNSNVKGITLIALVITIIVMLILVGVTVTVAMQGGLFKTAREATANTQEERDKEVALSDGKVEIDGEKYDSIDEYVKGGVVPTVDDYGKYVKYGVDLNGDNNFENDWKVFYVDDSGNTFIIAADYVTEDKCDELKTAIDKAHMTMLSEYCYCWLPTDVREGNDQKVIYHCYDGYNDDIQNDHTTKKEQCSFPELFMATENYCSDHVGKDGKGGNPNSRCASTLLCSGNWSSFVDKSYGASYAIGGPTLEMWVASWNKKHGNTEDTTKPLYCTGYNYGYCLGTEVSPTTFDLNGSDYYGASKEGYDDKLYFPHQSYNYLGIPGYNSFSDTCYGYYIASTPDDDTSIAVVFYTGKLMGYSTFYHFGLRPVVCLPSGVKLAKTAES